MSWGRRYLQSIKIKTDMAEEYGYLAAHVDHPEEYDKRVEAESIPDIIEQDAIRARAGEVMAAYPTSRSVH